MKVNFLPAAVLMGWLLAGCLAPHQVRKIEDDNALFRLQIDSLRTEMQRLKQAVAKAEQPATQAREATVRLSADTEVRLNQFAEQLRILTDRVDDLNNRVSNMPDKLRTAAEKISAVPPPVANANTQPVAPSGTTESPNMAKLYDTAYQDLVRGQYELARNGFTEFLGRFPDSPLADNAQYWIGESFYSQQQYNRAATEFAAVMQNYPNGDKVPAAMLKRAFAMISLSKRAEAKALLEQLVRQYPNSGEAELARARLKEL